VIRMLSRLFRWRLSLLNGIAAVTGCLLYSPATGRISMMGVFAGVSLLAASGSALNQVLERDLDRLMERTRLRPLPHGEMEMPAAALLGASGALSGCLVLVLAGGPGPALIGAFALVWYLGVYTPLKRRTSLSLAAGGLCGALPPLIGWCAAGGAPADFRIMLLCGLLYLWQIPHFWLFQRRHAADYQRAGIPLVAAGIGGRLPSQLLRLWVIALVVAVMMLPLFGVISHPTVLWYAVFAVPLLVLLLGCSDNMLFPYFNVFPLLVAVTLALQP